MAKKKRSTRAVVAGEISRASKRARPESQLWKGLDAAIKKSKRKVVGPVPPPAHVEIPHRAPRTTEGHGGRTVRKHGRG